MRSILVWGTLIVGAAGLAAPQVATAQIFPFANLCCRMCLQPHCTCTTVQPIIETRLRAEPVITLRESKQTSIRQQTVFETVPVTTVQNVTLDEGGFQLVWVPRPVTKQITSTELQTRVSQRSVPVEITHRVPEVATRLVPEQSVRYLTRQTHVVLGAPAPIVSTAVVIPPVAPIITQISPQPLVSLSPPVAASASPPPLAAGLVPDAAYADPAVPSTRWTTISSGSSRAATGYENVPATSGTNSRKLFVPAPSAAAVWQSGQIGGK